ncbi:DinB family protein [Lutibacter sp. HS1-25]|uniref:DinB family protein n=1 Tax=Lutibacter sp. HS1-25 TaxID=2485000 RepID=UPI0010100A60|nr:DinB family protein [Lutibacter sp. HS1-25]RXP64675.1 DinB family protein [Lutibacter sp. HS1-25]
MQKRFDTLLKTREMLLKVIAPLTNEQINKIPTGFKNNIAWNVAHLVVTQQLLCYKLSGLDCMVSDEMIENFKKETAPNYHISDDEFAIIKAQLLQLPVKLDEDYSNGIFKNYTEYTTSVNITLTSIEDAIDFNLFHEGIHLGVVLQLKKLV